MTPPDKDILDQLVAAAVAHVPFDGWSETTFSAAIAETGLSDTLARSVCPRGAVDLALAFHDQGDSLMIDRITATDMTAMKFRDKVTAALRFRLEVIEDKELVRRGVTLFALPQYAGDGAKAIWGTCDLIWDSLGDTSRDVNWYTKRATLSGVYSSTVLFWLGDTSPDNQATWDFLDRRIGNVMEFEKVKAQLRGNPVLKPFLALPERMLGHIRAPDKTTNGGLPGKMPGRR